MPFDALTPTAPDIDLSKPNLAALEHVLRHRELWPAGFTWNYSDWDCCAHGLANGMWGKLAPDWERIADRFGITRDAAFRIFVGAHLGVISIAGPDVVADAIARERARMEA